MKKILFIEDQRGFQKALVDYFGKNDYQTFSAFDGESGIKMAESELPDIIFLDLVIPRKSGFEVLEEIKENNSLNKIPVVVLTNLEGAQEVDRALLLGAKAFLVKASYSLGDLLKKANSILEKQETAK